MISFSVADCSVDKAGKSDKAEKPTKGKAADQKPEKKSGDGKDPKSKDPKKTGKGESRGEMLIIHSKLTRFCQTVPTPNPRRKPSEREKLLKRNRGDQRESRVRLADHPTRTKRKDAKRRKRGLQSEATNPKQRRRRN